MATYVGTHCEM